MITRLKMLVFVFLALALVMTVLYLMTREDEVIVPAMKTLSADSEYMLYRRGDDLTVLGEGKLGLFYGCLTGYRDIGGRRSNGDGAISFILKFKNGISLTISSTNTEIFQFYVDRVYESIAYRSDAYAVNCPVSLLGLY